MEPGGERARLMLAKVLKRGGNLLVQRDAFLCAAKGIAVLAALERSPGRDGEPQEPDHEPADLETQEVLGIAVGAGGEGRARRIDDHEPHPHLGGERREQIVQRLGVGVI